MKIVTTAFLSTIQKIVWVRIIAIIVRFATTAWIVMDVIILTIRKIVRTARTASIYMIALGVTIVLGVLA